MSTYKKLQNNHAKPRSYTRETKHIIGKDYSVSHKLDGEHRFLVCEKDETPYLLDVNDNHTVICDKKWSNNKLVIEGELYEGVLYAFDALVINDKDVTDLSFRKRYDYLTTDILPNVRIKEFHFTKKEGTVFTHAKKLLKNSAEYQTDGLIFMPQNKGYYDPTAFVYKWKPPHLLTIDFLIQDSKIYTAMAKHQFLNLKMNRLPEFRGIRVEKYFKLLFNQQNILVSKELDIPSTIHILSTTEPEKYENKIVECLYDTTIKQFIPIKIRTDKTETYEKNENFSGPNNYNTCIAILEEALNPITEEELVTC